MNEHVLLLFLLFYKCLHFVIHRSTISSHIAWIPPSSGPFAHEPEHNIQCLLFFFFFFQNPPIHKHWRAFFQTHIEKHVHVVFFCPFLKFHLVFLFFFLSKDRLCTYTCYMPLTNPVARRHETMCSVWVEEQKEGQKKAWRMEMLRGWVTETETKWAALVLEMESVIIFGATRCMHKQRVLAHRQPDYIAEGKTFWVQQVVF